MKRLEMEMDPSKKIREVILEIDEAVGSRIVEMAKGYFVKNQGENHRIKQ